MNLNAFLKENVKQVGVIKYSPSKRFMKEDGTLEEFQIRPLTAAKDSQIRKECYLKKGKTIEFDSEEYIRLIVANAVVYPNLKSDTLLQNYNVSKDTELLQVMLTAGEFQKLVNKVQEVNGFTELSEDVEIAKN